MRLSTQNILISALALVTVVYFVRRAGNTGRATGGAGSWRTPAAGMKYKPFFDQATLYYQLPNRLLSRMAQQESSYRPNVISPAGAVGLMQLIPRFHPGVDVTDPEDSVTRAAEYMRILFNRFGDWRLAMAAYNWGPTNLAKYGFDRAPLETKRYIANVAYDIDLK